MGIRRGCIVAVTLGFALALASEAGATSLVQMDLTGLCQRAGRIFRGTVIERTEGTLQAGGGTLPVTTYRVRVDEAFKGPQGAETAGAVVELKMLGEPRQLMVGRLKFVGSMRDLPRLEVGHSYLLFCTRPGAIGLSTTVGLGQGLFSLGGAAGQEKAVNAFDNAGLLGRRGPAGTPAARGPIAYDRLASAIRAELAAK